MECYYGIRVFSTLFGMQNQYFSRYLAPIRPDEPNLAEGLRVVTGRGQPYTRQGSYHDVYIHKDDAAELVRRVNAHRVALGFDEVIWAPPED